ncbi:MAG: 50S ribosomal protein L17 [Lentisphaerae bacterium]|jgi:large subunit ribosomal protein L17|nr:50S ribosomal protein L17 [Lentisphaerota bacterium]
MRHRKHTFKIGRTSAHRKSLLANAVCSLIEHGRITTTLVKAKEIRRVAEKMVTFGKIGTLHTRKLAIATLHQVDKVRTLFDVIAPGFKDRPGGYTRIMKLGPRIGDGAEMAIIEFVENDATVAARKAAPAAAEEAPVTEAPATEAEEAK